MRHMKNGTDHEETSYGMKRFADKPFRIIVMHLRERLIQGQLFVRAGFNQSLDFALC